MESPLRSYALVTGASSGIGRALAVELARNGYELLITARDAQTLEETARLVGATGSGCDVFLVDLAAPGAVDALIGWVGTRELAVLVNNAGFGDGKLFEKSDPARVEAMIQLNVLALSTLTRHVLSGMVHRHKGQILNVASTAAFLPVGGMAVYAATKAYVLSFSVALAEELVGSGVSVTALCPGPTLTGFAKRAAIDKTELFRSAMTAEAVAKVGLRGLESRRSIVIPGWTNRLSALLSGLLPRRFLAGVSKKLMTDRQS